MDCGVSKAIEGAPKGVRCRVIPCAGPDMSRRLTEQRAFSELQPEAEVLSLLGLVAGLDISGLGVVLKEVVEDGARLDNGDGLRLSLLVDGESRGPGQVVDLPEGVGGILGKARLRVALVELELVGELEVLEDPLVVRGRVCADDGQPPRSGHIREAALHEVGDVPERAETSRPRGGARQTWAERTWSHGSVRD